MTEISESYVLTFTEGHGSRIDVQLQIKGDGTEIQDTLVFNNLDRLDHAEFCTALYLLGFAVSLEQIVHDNNLTLRKIVLNAEQGKHTGFVEIELHGTIVHRVVQIAVADCVGVKDAATAARRRLVEIGRAVAEQAARRIHDRKADLAVGQSIQPHNALIVAGLAAVNRTGH